jgi:hypothetical protein
MKPTLPIIILLAIQFYQTAAAGEAVNLRADASMTWKKGNMHTHSLWSDGDQYPELIAQWYRDHGYQFLVFTDHNTLLNKERWIDAEKNAGGATAFEKLKAADLPPDWIELRDKDGRQEVRLRQFDEIFGLLAVPQEYLLVHGEEITDRFGRLPVHLCATNVSEVLPPLGGDSIVDVLQRNISAAVSRRERTGEKTMVHLNHPNFGYAVTAEQLMQIVGENFYEVYNGHPSVHNGGDAQHASTERMWDIINTWRLSKLDLPVMYGLATDDGHSYHVDEPGVKSQPGRGWVMALTDTLTPDALVTSLEAGNFYSSSGVTLSSVQKDDKSLSVVVDAISDATYTIRFIGTRKDFDDQSRPASDDADKADTLTRVYSDEVGEVLKTVTGTKATYIFKGDELYVRAVVSSSQLHPNPGEKGDFQKAWVQPIQP